MTAPLSSIRLPELKSAVTDRLPPIGQAAVSAALLAPTVVLYFIMALPFTAGWASSWNTMLITLWNLAATGALGAYLIVAIVLFARNPERRLLAIVVAGGAVVVELGITAVSIWGPADTLFNWFLMLPTAAVVVAVAAAWGIGRRNNRLWWAGLAPTLVAALILLSPPMAASTWYGFWFLYTLAIGLGCAFCWGVDVLASANTAHSPGAAAHVGPQTPASEPVADPVSALPRISTPGEAGDTPVPHTDQPVVVAVPVQSVAQTNSMAIAALVTSLVLAPLGVIFGHISLSQIKRTGEQGRGFAIAGLVIGYVGTAIASVSVIGVIVFVMSVKTSIDDFDSAFSSYTTATTTPSRTLVVSSPSSTSLAIKNAEVDDCINRVSGAKRSDGTRSVTVQNVSCSSSSATHRVTKITDDVDDCYDTWVRSTDYSPPIVLCLVDE